MYGYKNPCILIFQWHYQYKNFDPNSIKRDKKLYKDIFYLIHWIYDQRYKTCKN